MLARHVFAKKTASKCIEGHPGDNGPSKVPFCPSQVIECLRARPNVATETEGGVSSLAQMPSWKPGARHRAAVAGERNMSAGSGGPTPGPGGGPAGVGPGGSNPRKFSEKIALHTQRQAEETAAFQEVMMDITSTRLQAQKLRLARTQGPYYGGSLPNVNQIGRGGPHEQQVPFPPESARATRHHGLVERVHRERRFVSPVGPYRNRQVDNVPYNYSYLSPPADPSWRRNWGGIFPGAKGHLSRLPSTALSRTNSDSALHTSVMNPPPGDPFAAGNHALGGRHNVFPYPVPPIEENVMEDAKLLPGKAWDAKKFAMMSSRPKSCEVPGLKYAHFASRRRAFVSPEQPSIPSHGHAAPPALNISGSLPDLSSLHFPSPLPTPLDRDEPAYPGGGSAGNLASTLTQLGIDGDLGEGPFRLRHQAGVGAGSFGGAAGHPSLQSSLSNPNIRASLSGSGRPFGNSLSSPSSLGSSPSARGPSGKPASSYAGAASPRRRPQPSPPVPADPRRHHVKPFSPAFSPTFSPAVSPALSSIRQGVALDTSKMALEQRMAQSFPLGPAPQRPPLLAPHPAQPQNLLAAQHFQQQQQQHASSACQVESGVASEHYHLHVGARAPVRREAEAQRSADPHSAPDLYHDALLNSLLDDPYLNLQLDGKAAQQFPPADGRADAGRQSGLQSFLNEQNLNYGNDARRHNVPNIILTGDSPPPPPPPGLSKEITNALAHVPGFEMDPFALDDPLRMDALELDMLEGDLMLADPAVEDSFRSDRLK
ncbi:CREB-regulated transcription coactivator 2-like isoform X2 [Stigmatopora nigra]